MFQHRKLRVYQRALDLLPEIVRLVATARPGWPDLLDQLKRAATSIILNIAEGAAEFRSGEKARFYRMAIRSAAECDAAVDVLARVRVLPPGENLKAQEILEDVARMLVAMGKKVESRPAARISVPRSRVPAPDRRESG